MNKPSTPGAAIVDSLKEGQTFLAELSDKAIELATASEVFEHVPVIKWAVQTLKVKDAYHQYRLKRNCAALFQALSDCNSANLSAFQSKLDESPIEAEEFADTTFSILLESTKPVKAEIYGKLLRSRIDGHLTREEFEQLAYILQAASIPALNALGLYLRSSTRTQLMPEEPLIMSMGLAWRYGTNFQVTDLGKKLYEALPLAAKG